jgi:transcriptional regulator with XRE-family HTH domain
VVATHQRRSFGRRLAMALTLRCGSSWKGEKAAILGFADASSLSRWEQGVCLPSVMNLFRLARLYRTSVFRPCRNERPVASYSFGSAKCYSPSLGDPYMNCAPTTLSKP